MSGIEHRTDRLRAAFASSLEQHEAYLGALPDVSAGTLRRLIADAGVTGRGGAGFPAARKLDAVARRPAAVVVANAAEGEPASSKDTALLAGAPHLVLDGVAVAAAAVSATSAYLYGPADLLERVVRPALETRRDRVRVSLVAAPDTFLAGQESAAVAAINGGRALPSTTPPPVFERGVDGRPTLVHNIETLAHFALIARYGPRWFRSVGTPDDPGSRLLTVSGAVQRPGVYEVGGGIRLGDVISLAGGADGPVGALLVGGYHGGWIPFTDATTQIAFSRSGLADFDAAPGAGVVVALPRRSCGLLATARLTTYLSGQNAGQCGPCRNGLPTLAAQLNQLALDGGGRAQVAELQRVGRLVAGRGACHHPRGTVRLIDSALRTFADDVDAHRRGRCLAARGTDRRPA